eukprot:TRINITY_DN32550_c0_g1_i1.p1 TRINITY_DN32550_c0_g1~~TRINITY_DN32550_c0_g1_i1.p1  ORF type:complete len:1472 (+),score=241.00 TRINITY_DN32550_c0_g1_i1:120-4535(+)
MSLGARRVALQLDYYMSSQFAGIALGAKSGLYKKAGLDIQFLPTCPPGDEAKIVSLAFQRDPTTCTYVGCMEQNTLLPEMALGRKVTPLAAMFGRSPLCLTGMPGAELRRRASQDKLRVAAHVDTVDLLKRILPQAVVLPCSRKDKLTMLKSGEVDAVQAYDVMETLKLARDLKSGCPEVLPLEGSAFPEVSLGYAQVLFAPTPALDDPEQQQVLRAFFRATFDGWAQAVRDPSGAAQAVLEVQGQSEHWISSPEFVEDSVKRCCEYVKLTMKCGQLGVIDRDRWEHACHWLQKDSPSTQGIEGTRGIAGIGDALNNTLWGPGKGQEDAHPVAQSIREETAELVKQAVNKHGRSPKLVVVTVGDSALGHKHPDGLRRLQLFAHESSSWFSKAKTGASLGIEVEEVSLPGDCDTQSLLSTLRKHRDADGLQLMWPLPQSIDAKAAYEAIPWAQDVDGSHFLGRALTPGGSALDSYAPTTCQGVMRVLDHYKIDLMGARAVIIGCSWLVGQPLAHLLGSKGMTVTLVNSSCRDLGTPCLQADLIVSAAGRPRLLKSEWVKPGAVVINVGTSFLEDSMIPDIPPLEHLKHAKLVVRTVGPTSIAALLRNVAQNALCRDVQAIGATSSTPSLPADQALGRLGSGWSLVKAAGTDNPCLQRTFHFPTYPSAVDFVAAVCKEAEQLNHHPNLQLTHLCQNGATVTADLSTFATGELSEYDCKLAAQLDSIYFTRHESKAKSNGEVEGRTLETRMEEFRYELPDLSIAKFPAVRGRSRLLVVHPAKDEDGPTLLDKHVSDLPGLLPPGSHLVCNESQVFAARLFATASSSLGAKPPVEVMFLSPEKEGLMSESVSDPAAALLSPADGQLWRCMIRSKSLGNVGQILEVVQHDDRPHEPRRAQLVVERIFSNWYEEGEPDGVEAAVRLQCPADSNSGKYPSWGTARDFFDSYGEVPLPPYLGREAQGSDTSDYQTVFASASSCGSVAAPTAGLHFTPALLTHIQATGIKVSRVSLHVGSGTFRPVTSASVADHSMHSEVLAASVEVLEDIAQSMESGRPMVLVGTTSVRALESLYWLGVMDISENKSLELGQWEAYRLQTEMFAGTHVPPQEALRRLIARARRCGDTVVRGSTKLCIVPGYKFRMVDVLVTNFHQPDSTLMPLVAAFAGKSNIQSAYKHALSRQYRFLSYGDATLLFNQTTMHEAPWIKLSEESSSQTTNAQEPHESSLQPRRGDKVLLHSCCAPCSGAMIEEMRLSHGLDVTIFFYNPNIHPRKEYEVRKTENMRYAEQLGIPFVDCDYDVDEWYRRAKGMEFCPERGRRCSMCFDMRFERTALHAFEHGFQWFTTTNATSRWKDADQVNDSGTRAASKYPGVKYWVYDWQTQAMTDRKYAINADFRFYKQEYCGCSYSLRDSNAYRKSNGMPPVMIGGDTTYSDPIADAAEESPEVVKAFFEEVAKDEDLSPVYSGRRKNAPGDENW